MARQSINVSHLLHQLILIVLQGQIVLLPVMPPSYFRPGDDNALNRFFENGQSNSSKSLVRRLYRQFTVVNYLQIVQ